MISFKRKKKEDDEIEEEESAKPDKKTKATKRTRKKEKKEPPKPWGKAERFLVFGLLIGTVLASLVLALYARSWKWPGLPRLKLPEDAFEEVIILEGKPAEPDISEQVKKEITELTRDLSGVYGLYVVDLFNGSSFGINEDELFQAASLIKLPVMAMFYEQVEKRNIALSDTHVLSEADKVGGSGSLYYEPTGTVKTYDELLLLMGKQSDNTAFNILVNELGEEAIQTYIEEIGMRDTSLETNMTTPRDMGLFFRKLWEGRLMSPAHRDDFFSYLTETIYENWLPAELPNTLQVAHKFGRELHVVNDAGIVFSEEPYVVIVMSKGIIEKEADAIIPKISLSVYNTLQTN